MIRVLHVGPKNFPPSHGGVEKSIFDLVRNFEDIDSYVAVEWNSPPDPKVIALPSGLVRRFLFIRRCVREKEIDFLHFNKEGFIPIALLFQLFSRTPVALTVRGCAWRLAKWPFAIRAAFYTLDLLACLLIPNVAFVGLRDKLHFNRIFPWRKLLYIPNGVESHEYSARGGAGEFVYVGRISEEKNLLTIIDWFRGQSASLTVFGPIDDRSADYGQRVLNAIEGLPNVTYGGTLSHADLFAKLSEYGAFINASFSEGMPVSVLEAASVGLPLVLSDIQQHRDLGFPDCVYVSPSAESADFLAGFGGYSRANQGLARGSFSIRAACARYEAIYRKELRNE